MRSILFGGAARRWSLSVALLAGLATLIVSLAATTNAQDNPRPPHWFWGTDMDRYVGDKIVAINESGVQVGSSDIDNQGGWAVTVSPDEARTVTLRLVTATGDRETTALDVMDGGFDPDGLSISEFSNRVTDEIEATGDTLSVRIIARRAEDGRIEFGMRDPDGKDIFPRARYFPATGPDHNRFLRSSEIDFGDGFTGRIIARRAPDGRVEFGFRVEGYDDIFPRARYFPATGPDHNRFLRSSEIEIGQPR